MFMKFVVTKRQGKMAVNCILSPVTSGVLQGMLLGLILLIITLPDIKSQKCTVNLMNYTMNKKWVVRDTSRGMCASKAKECLKDLLQAPPRPFPGNMVLSIQGQTVSREFYCSMLKCLKENIE